MALSKDHIKAYAAAFLDSLSEKLGKRVEEWNQELHVAFVAYVLEREVGLEPAQKEAVFELATAMPALLTNASAFKQTLQNPKGWALLPPAEDTKAKLGNRYAGMI